MSDYSQDIPQGDDIPLVERERPEKKLVMNNGHLKTGDKVFVLKDALIMQGVIYEQDNLVFTSKAAALVELDAIKEFYLDGVDYPENWRAITPEGQTDALSIEFREGRNWTPGYFCSISPCEVL